MTNTNVVFVIMAAGEGKRMNSNVPKVLHEHDGVPMLVKIIRTTQELAPKKIIIITGRHYQLIQKTCIKHLISLTNFLFVRQEQPLGTGDAIKSILGHCNKDEKIVILNGDMPLINVDILHRLVNLDGQMTLLVGNMVNPYGYGRVVLDGSGSTNAILEIIEEKDCTEEQKKITLVNAGVYSISGELLLEYIPQITNNNTQKEYYMTDIVKIVKTKTNVNINVCIVDESENKYIRGVNTQKELEDL